MSAKTRACHSCMFAESNMADDDMDDPVEHEVRLVCRLSCDSAGYTVVMNFAMIVFFVSKKNKHTILCILS